MSHASTEPKSGAQGTVKPVVTLFELYGAGADYVGHKVAEALGLPFHEQAFSSEALEATQADSTEERAVLARVLSVMGGAYGGFGGFDVPTTQREAYDLVMDNNRQVREYAAEGGVIVGRNGAVILADRPNTVHVLLTGDVQDRIKRAAQQEKITEGKAAERQRREDDVRGQMSVTLYGWDPRLPDRYDLVFNTSRVDLDRVVESILAACERGG